VIGCDCATCRSPDPRDRRTRHGLLIETGGTRLLVDTPPELRLQLLRAGVERLDAVFLSHEHADHTHGIDDLRVFSLRQRRLLPLYVAREFDAGIRTRFSYIWGGARPQPGSAVPRLDLRLFDDRDVIEPGGLALQVVALPHGAYRSYGFRLGGLGVLLDAKSVPEDALEIFAGVAVLVTNALWFGDPHPGHFSMEEAVATARRLGAARTYITHIAHRTSHEEIERRLPAGVAPAYDGLVVEL